MAETFFNEAYEQIILGIMILNNSLIDIISAKLNKEAFYTSKAKFVFETIVNQWKKDHCVDIVNLTSTLKAFDSDYLVTLTDLVPSTANWEFYVNKVREMYLARTFKTELGNSLADLSPSKINEIISNLQVKLSSFMQFGTDSAELKNLCLSIPEEIKAAHTANKKYIGFESGFEQLDDIIDGWQTSCMYVIGARTSIGKTAFVLTLLRKLCQHNVSATLFSLEMSAKQDFYRMLAAETNLPMWQLKKGTCLEYQRGVEKLMAGLSRLFDYNLNIIDQGANKEDELYARIRYEAVVKGKKLFVIDHLGLVQSSTPTAQHYLDVGRITATLHAMSKELDICIITLVQMNREAEGKKPTLSQIRESGNIEQDADVIMFLYRERDLEEDNIPTQLIVEKNRDGKTGYVNFVFEKPTQNFKEEKSNFNKGQLPVIPVNTGEEVKDEGTDIK